MSTHPLNSALRFILELIAIITVGYWGYQQSESWVRILLAFGLPILFASLWGIFAVRDDPSRSGKTVVSTPGIIRLMLELLLFTTSTWMLLDLEYLTLSWLVGAAVIIHYIISYDRINWLLKQKIK